MRPLVSLGFIVNVLSCGNSGDGADFQTAASGGAPASVGGSSSGGVLAWGGNGAGANGSSSPEMDCRTDGDQKTTLVFVNRCSDPLNYAGSDIAGGTLATGEFRCVDIGSDVESLSAKRYWGFVGEDPGAEHHSLAEFTFNTDFYDFDWYNISYVDAFNLPIQIVPVARHDCETLTCAEDLLPNCPDVGVYEDSTGVASSCVSRDRNHPQSPVALYFEQRDDAYAWSGTINKGRTRARFGHARARIGTSSSVRSSDVLAKTAQCLGSCRPMNASSTLANPTNESIPLPLPRSGSLQQLSEGSVRA